MQGLLFDDSATTIREMDFFVERFVIMFFTMVAISSLITMVRDEVGELIIQTESAEEQKKNDEAHFKVKEENQ